MVSHCGPLLVIEFLASIEPASIPLLAVLVFSLSLYPLGFMLGASCSPCCDIPCGECSTGKLPDTVTVTFEGYPDVGPSFPALFVSFESCFGSGATATPTTAAGVITGVTVTNGGSGYATLARVEPTITADGPGGSGADITVTLSEEEDECSLPYWTISGLTVVDGGSGYTDGDEIVFTLGAGETEQSAAFALIQTSRDEPDLTIEPPEDTGTGATFTVSLTATGSNPQTWFISGITVDDGGTGYSDGSYATVGLGSGDVEQSQASLVIRTVRDEPELTLSGPADLTVNVVSLGGTPETWAVDSITVTDGGSGYSDEQTLNVILGPDDVDLDPTTLEIKTVRDDPTLFAQAGSGSGGSGAVLVVNVVQSGDIWAVASITVTNGGSGYTQGETFSILPSAGQTVSPASVTANVTGGVITSFTIGDAGEYFLDTGVIDEVQVVYGGSYYKDTGVIESVDIDSAGIYYKALGDIASINLSNGGEYYAEDPDGTPHVAAVTVSLSQIDPSDGAGATFTVNVDDDPDSPTFGDIASVTVTNGGSGYEAVGYPNTWCMGDYMNGREFVLARSKFFGSFFNIPSYACEYRAYLCNPVALGTYSSAAIVFEYREDTSTEPAKSLLQGPLVSLTTEEQIANCSSFTLEFPDKAQSVPAFNDVTATVVSGGGSVEDATGSPVVPSIAGGSSHATGVCGSCCLNEEATPAEITINLEYLIESSFGRPAEGDYVLSRGSRLISTNANTTLWEGGFPYVFEGTTYAFTLEAAIEPCATLSNTGPGLLHTFVAADCDDTCYKKCRLRINLYSGEFEFVPGVYNPGCECIDFPVCSPPAGAYTLVSGAFNTPAYTATIT